MLMLLSSKAQGCKDWLSKTCHVGIHWKALAEYSQMSTHVPGFQSFFRFFASIGLAKLTTSSIRVNHMVFEMGLGMILSGLLMSMYECST